MTEDKPTLTPWEEQLRDIEALIDDESIRFDFYVGSESLKCDSYRKQIRRAVFELADGVAVEPTTQGDVAISDATTTENATFAAAQAGIVTDVNVHIITESAEITWLLLGNIVEASRSALKKNSVFVGNEFIPDVRDLKSYEYGGYRYMILRLQWKMHIFKGITPLPPCGLPIDEYLKTGQLGTALNFTHTGEVGTPP